MIDLLFLARIAKLPGLSEEFRIHNLWEQPDRAQFFADVGPQIRAAVTFSGAGAFDEAMFARLPNLEIITNVGAGFESIDAQAAKAHNVIVTNGGDTNAPDVAEFAFAILLDVARKVTAGDGYVRAGSWAKGKRPRPVRRASGRPIGILGLGNIGLEVAKRARGFDMDVAYHNRNQRRDVDYKYFPSAVELARAVDFLVVAVTGDPQAKHVVNRDVIEALGPDGILVNIARGSVVDEGALIDALSDGRLGGAGLDVFEREPEVPAKLLALPNVVVGPHHAGATWESINGVMSAAADNLNAHFAGNPVKFRVI